MLQMLPRQINRIIDAKLISYLKGADCGRLETKISWNGSFRITSMDDFSYLRIVLRASGPGRYRFGFFIPPEDGA